MKEELEDELEALRSIFEENLVVKEAGESTIIEVKLKPAEDDVNGQLLFMTGTLSLTLPVDYPFDEEGEDKEDVEGEDLLRGIQVSLASSRGLSDADANSLVHACESSVRESLVDDPGAAVIYDALEAAREALTECVEEARCSICLEKLGSSSESTGVQ